MIALCFCKFTLIHYFIYMNLACSLTKGQLLVASIYWIVTSMHTES